jgi:hypothetical protein
MEVWGGSPTLSVKGTMRSGNQDVPLHLPLDGSGDPRAWVSPVLSREGEGME